MGDEGTTMKSSSTSLRKAITQNQTFDKDLKKELQYLDLKKKSSEKMFEHKRSQFLRKRLCLSHLKSPGSSLGKDATCHVQVRTGLTGLQDFESSYSTGNLLEALVHTRRTPSPVRKRGQLSDKKLHKLSLDSDHECQGTDNKDDMKRLVRLSSGKTMAKSLSWGEDLSVKDTQDSTLIKNSSSTTLQVPLLPMFFSQSDEILHKRSQNHSAVVVVQEEQQISKDNNKKSRNLSIPSLDKRLTRSDEHLGRIARPRTANYSQGLNVPPIEREHTYCGETSQSKNSVRPKSTHLVLPPLTRQRSKSLETALVDKQHAYNRNTDVNSPNSVTSHRRQRLSLSSRAGKAKLSMDPRKSSSFGESTRKDSKGATEEKASNEKQLQRSSSTPDLSDLGPEVEYLLMNDDQTRLQRMRAAVLALRFTGNIHECRYIRKDESFQQEQYKSNDKIEETKSRSNIRDLAQNGQKQDTEVETAPENKSSSEHSETVSVVAASGDYSSKEITTDSHYSENQDKPIMKLDESLSSSNNSTLAEMFAEIKNTRYLRMPETSRSEDLDDDDDDDVCKTSHGYNTPLIIVGHTKAVLMEGNKLD